MPAPERIKQLVETFEQNINEYRSSKNETELRRQFLDPFFEALGWDVDNKKGYDERNKEVAHEHSVEIDGQQKKADYAFRTGKDAFDFLVEAKKPSVKVENSLEAAYQLRRYGWSARIPINILTDFEHFAIYDCRTRPIYAKDKAGTGRINIIHYKEYVDRWDEIAALFSPEAIRKGALEKYKDDLKGKKGTQEVDDAFLEEIEAWREALARNIATRNKHLNLNEEQVNFAVQMTIDRIIFLRIAEERGMEKDRRLFELCDYEEIYKNLLDLFQQADQRYNSGLFHFKKDKDRENPDMLSPSLEIDDKVLKDIIKDLYYPSPYAFNYIPTEILGSVYERFLGKVIRLTAGGNAKVEEKPEVRKAGGVYYTPAYIVDYIVKNTVGRLVSRIGNPTYTPAEVSNIKIVDPACGSGSFLLGAYQFLLDWHLDWYVKNDLDKSLKKKTILTQDNKTYRLSIDEKKRILLNNIHGVDLDSQAVEVTKLSLLLKVVEDPGQLKMFEEGHILPNLNKNIKNGNALIGTDYFSGQMFGDMEEMKRVKPFDWKNEFPEVFKHGGFDVVIGNPPYVRQEILGEDFKSYAQKKFATFAGTADLFVYFIEHSLNILRTNGMFSFIVANKWMRANYGQPLRNWLKQQNIEEIIDFGDLPVFETATTYPCILRLSKKTTSASFNVVQVKSLDFQDLNEYVGDNQYEIDQSSLSDSGWSLVDRSKQALLEKLQSTSIPLGKYVNGRIFYGIKTGFNEAFVIDQETKIKLINEHPSSKEIIKPFLAGRDIKRFEPAHDGRFLIFTRHGIDINKYPAIHKYLLQFKEQLMPKPKNWKGSEWKGRKPGSYEWYEIQDTIDYYMEFEKPKIIVPAIVQRASYTFDRNSFYSNDKTSIIGVDDLYLLGILNSKVPDFVMHSISSTKQGGYFEYKPMYLEQLPIRAINFNDPAEKAMHDKMVSLVEQMLSLHKQSAREGIPVNEKELLQRQIKSTDGMIDELVYQLYGLSEEEIKIVES